MRRCSGAGAGAEKKVGVRACVQQAVCRCSAVCAVQVKVGAKGAKGRPE